MDFKLGRATSFPASLDCPDRVLALSAGHAEAPNKHLFLVGPVRHIRQQIEIVSPTDLGIIEIHLETIPSDFGLVEHLERHRCVLLVLGKDILISTSISLAHLILVMMFGLQRKSNKEKHPRLSVSQTAFKYALNTFDEYVDVQEKPNRWSKEHVNTSKDVADPKRKHFQFDVQQFCDNFVKGVDKALKDVSKNQKKSTSTRAPVAEPSLFISKETQEPIESLIICEQSCDLSSLEPEFMVDNEQAIVELTVLQPEHPSSFDLFQQVFKEEPLNFPHQCPCLDTWISLDDGPDPMFDEEDESGPVFDDEETSIMSTFMKSQLCFDSSTFPTPLSFELQEYCEEPSFLNSLPDIFVKISTHDVIRFGLDKMKEFCVSKSVFDNMINSFKVFEPDKFLE
uniref:Uncharacterized protein n=1 Tax=Brassica oleracea var. oleracea TaxID=109376 RepID=A0A0D3E9N2_BRAOL